MVIKYLGKTICLKCGKIFDSKYENNRICDECKKQNEQIEDDDHVVSNQLLFNSYTYCPILQRSEQMIRKYLPEIMAVIVVGFFIGLMFSFYQLERAKVRVYAVS